MCFFLLNKMENKNIEEIIKEVNEVKTDDEARKIFLTYMGSMHEVLEIMYNQNMGNEGFTKTVDAYIDYYENIDAQLGRECLGNNRKELRKIYGFDGIN